MLCKWLWVLGLLTLGVASGWTQTYGPGEIDYGGIRLQFSGRVLTTGTCAGAMQPAPGVTEIRCQLPEGAAGTIELTATRTPAGAVNIRIEAVPAGWPSSLWVQQLGQWADSRTAAASGWGTVAAQYRFTAPAGSAGRQFALRFKAWTAGVIGELELRVIVDVVKAVTPPPTEPTVPSSYGPFAGTTDGAGRFEVPIPTLPNTAVTGQLTECTVRLLPRTQVSVTLVPKPGVTTISRPDQIGAVRVSSPGYGEVEIAQLMLASSMDMFGRTSVTVGVGTVCLRPTAPPVTPPPPTFGPITGTTDAEGKFTGTLAPGVTVTGRLTECTVKPLPNQQFTLTPIPKGEVIASPEDIAGFTFSVPGYAETMVTKFSKLSLFGLTWYDTGPVCLLVDKPPCREVELRVLTQNCQLIPEVWTRTPPLVGAKVIVFKGTPHKDARCAEFARLVGAGQAWTDFDIICLQEVFSHAGKNHDFKNSIARAWLGDPEVDLAQQGWFTLDRNRGENVGQAGDQAQVTIMRREPPNTDVQQVAVLKKGKSWVVTGPDSTASPRYTIDGGLMILSKHPVVAVSGFTFSDQVGIVEEMSNKGALYARVQLDPDRPECYIHVFNTHLAAEEKNAEHRQKQLGELRTFIENCIRDPATGNPDGRPIILCGDLNIIGGSQEWKDRLETFEVTGKRLEDVWLKLGRAEDKDAATWVGNDQDATGTPWGPRNALATEPGPFQRLDYILFFAGEELLTLTAESVSREPEKQRDRAWPWDAFTVSDHLGVKATFKVVPK